MATRSRYIVSFGGQLNLDLRVGEKAPPTAEALVIPQDVNLIMGEVGLIEDTAESPEEVLATCETQAARRPGTILVTPAQGTQPVLLQAVVYDFQRQPPASAEHVFEALLTAFEACRSRGLSTIALRPLGTEHAGLDAGSFIRLLSQVCYTEAELGTTIRQVHLMLSSAEELTRYESFLGEIPHPSGV